MPNDVQLYGFAGQIEWQEGPYRKLLAAPNCALRQGTNQVRRFRTGVELGVTSAFKKIQRPPSKPFLQVIDLEGWRGQFATIPGAPRQRVQTSVNRPCGPTSRIEVNRAEANDWTERALPGKTA